MDILDNDFIDYQYPLSVLEKLKTFWLNKTLCDATLEAGPVKVYVHRLILLAAIPGLTQWQIPNSGKPLELILPASIKADALNSVVQYWYTGTLHLTPQNAPWVEQIVHLLGLESLYTYCKQYHNYLRQKKILIPVCELFKNPVVVLCELERVTQLHYLESKDHLPHFQRQNSTLAPVVIKATNKFSNTEALETNVKKASREFENPELALNHSDFTLGTFPQSSLKERLHFQICRSTREDEKSEASSSENVPSQQIITPQSPVHIPGLVDLSNNNGMKPNSKSLQQRKKPPQTRTSDIPKLQETPETRTGVQCNIEQRIKQEPGWSDSDMDIMSSCEQGDNQMNQGNSGDKRETVYKFISRLVDKYMEDEPESTDWLMKDKQLDDLNNQTSSSQTTANMSATKIIKEKEKAGRKEEIIEETNQKCTTTEQPLVIQYDTCPSCNLTFHSEEQIKAHLNLHLTLCQGSKSSEQLTPNTSVINQRPSTSSSENLTPNSSVLNHRTGTSSSENLTPNSSVLNHRISTSSSENLTPNSSVWNHRTGTSSSENLTPNTSVLNRRNGTISSGNLTPNTSVWNVRISTSSSENLTPNISVLNHRIGTISSENLTPNSSVWNVRVSTSSSENPTSIPFVLNHTPTCSTSFSEILTPGVGPSPDPRSANQQPGGTSLTSSDQPCGGTSLTSPGQQCEDVSLDTEDFTAYCPLCLMNFVSRKAYTAHLNICFNTFHHRQQNRFLWKEWNRLSLGNRVSFQSSSSGRTFSFLRPIYTSSTMPTDDTGFVNSVDYTSSSMPTDDSGLVNSVAYTSGFLSADVGNAGNTDTRLTTGTQEKNALAPTEREISSQRENGDVDLCGNTTSNDSGDPTPSEKVEGETVSSVSCQTGTTKEDLEIKITDVRTLKDLPEESSIPLTAAALEHQKTCINQTQDQAKHNNFPVNKRQKSMFEVTAEGNKLFIKKKAVNDKGQSKALNDKGQGKAVNDKGQSKAVNDKGLSKAVNDKGQSKAVNDKGQGKAVNDKGQVKAVNDKGQGKAVNEKGQSTAVNDKGPSKAVNGKEYNDQICEKPKTDDTKRRGKGKQNNNDTSVQGRSVRWDKKNGKTAPPVLSAEIKDKLSVHLQKINGQGTAKIVISQTPIKKLTKIVAAVAQKENNFKMKKNDQGSDGDIIKRKNSTEVESPVVAGNNNTLVDHENKKQSSRKIYRFKNQPKDGVPQQCLAPRSQGHIKPSVVTASVPAALQKLSSALQTQNTTMYNSVMRMAPAVNVNSQMPLRKGSIEKRIASVYRKNCIIIPKEWKKWKEDTPKLEGTSAPCQYPGTGAPCHNQTGTVCQHTEEGAPCQYKRTSDPGQYTVPLKKRKQY